MHILFPGRHHLLTDFQFKYLYNLIQTGLKEEKDVYGYSLNIDSEITDIIFAVTSVNHSNARRNPMPFYLRAIALEDFASDLNGTVYVCGIDDVGHLPNKRKRDCMKNQSILSISFSFIDQTQTQDSTRFLS